MKENEMSVLEQYDIDVKSTRRIRGAVLCDTNRGLCLLKELKISEKRVPLLYQLCMHLENMGYGRIDRLIENKDNELISNSEDGMKYILKKWYDGKECDIRKERDMTEAADNLARIHRMLRAPIVLEESDTFVLTGEDLRQEYERHNREMKKVRSFIRTRVGKGEFELAFLKHFDGMYEWAEGAGERIRQSGYEALLEKSRGERTFTHGEYNYHNILMMEDGIATTNFDHFRQEIQLLDLYYFLRKAMEKNYWDASLGHQILNAYSRIEPLGSDEMEYLAVSLSYPEKFWKAADSYYRSSKAWIPMKSLEKLETAIRQTEEKKRFLETIFAFHL